MAYPAGVPISMDNATVMPATMTLRPSAAGTPSESQKKLIVPVDQSGHSDFGYWYTPFWVLNAPAVSRYMGNSTQTASSTAPAYFPTARAFTSPAPSAPAASRGTGPWTPATAA